MKRKFILGIIITITAGLITGVGAGALITKLHPKDVNTYNDNKSTDSAAASDSNYDKNKKTDDKQNNKDQKKQTSNENTKDDEKDKSASQNSSCAVKDENEALKIINKNDDKMLNSFGTPKLVFSGMASQTTINALNSNYDDMDINEKIYTFSLYVTDKTLDDYSVLGTPVYLYYVGADSEIVYRVSGNNISDIIEVENDKQVSIHEYNGVISN